MVYIAAYTSLYHLTAPSPYMLLTFTGPATGIINVIDGQAGSIQRADVAAFCLGAVTDLNFPYVRKTPCISGIGGTGWVKEPKAGFDGPKTA